MSRTNRNTLLAGTAMRSKPIFILSIVLILVLALIATASAEKKWTIMVYCCADNNLDEAGVNDLNELELSGSDENLNIIFLLDRWGNFDTHLYYVEHDPDGLPGGNDNNTISTIIDDSAPWLAVEEDMGNPATLQDFVIWSMQNYPAEHYLLSIWDHGSGIFKDGGLFPTKGECWDDNGGDPNDYIDLAELKSVMSAAKNSIGRKLDIVGHDVCVAGQYETHYQMRDYADISIASADNEPMEGWDYHNPFVNLKNDPLMTPTELANQIVYYYWLWYGPDPHCCNTMAAVDLGLMTSDFMPVFENFCDVLVQNFNDCPDLLRAARNDCASYNFPNFDLWNYAEFLTGQEYPVAVQNAAAGLISALETMFINHKVGLYSNGTGCTIWFPSKYSLDGNVEQYENQIDFANTGWPRFLRVFAGEFIINTQSLPDAYVNSAYYQEFTAFNGTAPYHWEKVTGQYPYGMTFRDGSTANISGTPTYAATFGFTLRVTDSSEPPLQDEKRFYITVNDPLPIRGDADGSGKVDITDAVFLVNYIFLDGLEPDPMILGDANCDGTVNLVDVIYLINYVFRSGPPPCEF